MESHPHLLCEYQQILTLSEQMLTLAAEEKWDRLIGMEVLYLKAIESITAVSISSCASYALQEALRQTLKTILANETEIKRLLQRRLNTLNDLVAHSTCQQTLNITYSRFPDHAQKQDF